MSYAWYDSSWNRVGYEFDSGRYWLRIDAYAISGYRFNSNAQAYINNVAVPTTVNGDGSILSVSAPYMAIEMGAQVVKSPTKESVKPSEWASFAASAAYTKSFQWLFESPDGKQQLTTKELMAKFPEVNVKEVGGVQGNHEAVTTVNVYGIPAELDGWKVICEFQGIFWIMH